MIYTIVYHAMLCYAMLVGVSKKWKKLGWERWSDGKLKDKTVENGRIIYRVLIDRWRYSWIDRGDIVEWIRDEKTD